MPSAARSVADRLVLFSADHDHRRGAFPDLHRIVLDPARLRQDLLVFELMAPHLGAVVVEDHASGAGGALVDGCDEIGHRPTPCSPRSAPPIVHHGLHGFRPTADIDRMPRGGPDASCLDRLLQTDRLEYLDRDDVDDGVKRSVIRALEWTGEFFGNTEKFAAHRARRGRRRPRPARSSSSARATAALSRKLLEWHPTAELTVTDVEPASVAAIAAGDLGEPPAGGGPGDGRHRYRRRRRPLRPGGVRALLPPSAAGAGLAARSPKAPGWPTNF